MWKAVRYNINPTSTFDYHISLKFQRTKGVYRDRNFLNKRSKCLFIMGPKCRVDGRSFFSKDADVVGIRMISKCPKTFFVKNTYYILDPSFSIKKKTDFTHSGTKSLQNKSRFQTNHSPRGVLRGLESNNTCARLFIYDRGSGDFCLFIAIFLFCASLILSPTASHYRVISQ